MKKKIIIAILTIFFSINFTNLLANPKLKIIENLKGTETLKFHFNQISLNNNEEGICFLKIKSTSSFDKVQCSLSISPSS